MEGSGAAYTPIVWRVDGVASEPKTSEDFEGVAFDKHSKQTFRNGLHL